MPRGRHRHAPPLHRLLVPSAEVGVALVCAGSAWLIGDSGDPDVLTLRALTAVAALAAVAGAVLLRRWDREAGRRVGEVKAAKATAEWRAEERQAELETELEESQEIRRKMEAELRGKRAELERLRTEHAALLRRYATAETERASALEGRRQLALEAADPAKALTAGAADHRRASGAPTPLTYLQADEALGRLRVNALRQREERHRHEQGEREREGRERRGREMPALAPAAVPAPSGPAQEPYPRRATGPGSTAPRGGFDFFGTQKRPRTPGTQGGPAGTPASDQEDDHHRGHLHGGPSDRPAPGPGPASGPAPAPTSRGAQRAVAGKVIDLGTPAPGDEPPAAAPGSPAGHGGDGAPEGPPGRLRRARV